MQCIVTRHDERRHVDCRQLFAGCAGRQGVTEEVVTALRDDLQIVVEILADAIERAGTLDHEAVRDAIAATRLPAIEVHLSNVFARESFRRESYFTDIAVGIISGLGAKGYELALEFALQYPGKG